MASVQKTASGYRAQVAVKGVRDSKTFRTKREADAWAAARETELRDTAAKPIGQQFTLAKILARYRDEVSPGKRGEKWETLRINAWLRDEYLPLAVTMADLGPDHFVGWRNHRMKIVTPGTVLREIGLLTSIMSQCRKEWRLIDDNPISDLRRPAPPDHRDVIITWRQVRGMVTAMGYVPGKPIRTVSQAVAVCFLVALRTGMRAGELCGLTWDRVKADHVILLQTKTMPRKVPLSKRARRLINLMKGWDSKLVFGIQSNSLDALFRKYRTRAGLTGFTFHDSRHTAATMLARKIEVLDLCKMFGWSNPKMAMIYYNPTASDIAARLD
jgi:integrase